MNNPSTPGSFGHLLQKTTLNKIYEKFHTATFTTPDVVTALYWIGSVERHVQYMQRKGWIVLDDERKFRFEKEPSEWVYGGEIH